MPTEANRLYICNEAVAGKCTRDDCFCGRPNASWRPVSICYERRPFVSGGVRVFDELVDDERSEA